jgi:RNA polymerase sigma-70 factor (ECF subfamily)
MPQPATEDDIRRIYQATIDDFYRVVARRCDGDRDLAEDIVQESWLRAVRTWGPRGIPDVPLAWLTTVARNLLANHSRRRPHESLDTSTPHPTTDDGLPRVEARQSLVTRALARLSIPNLRLLHAFHFRRQHIADIAVEHGLTERAVEGRLRRARQQLRHHIESDPDSEGDLP